MGEAPTEAVKADESFNELLAVVNLVGEQARDTVYTHL